MESRWEGLAGLQLFREFVWGSLEWSSGMEIGVGRQLQEMFRR